MPCSGCGGSKADLPGHCASRLARSCAKVPKARGTRVAAPGQPLPIHGLIVTIDGLRFASFNTPRDQVMFRVDVIWPAIRVTPAWLHSCDGYGSRLRPDQVSILLNITVRRCNSDIPRGFNRNDTLYALEVRNFLGVDGAAHDPDRLHLFLDLQAGCFGLLDDFRELI